MIEWHGDSNIMNVVVVAFGKGLGQRTSIILDFENVL
jgi:hypothetical protein